jgi:hypothetical protein
MSYLSQSTSKTNYGVIQIGDFIDVEDGIVSLSQDVSPTADVVFNTVTSDAVYSDGKLVVTTVSPTSGFGISITDITSTGPDAQFKINNTGVLSITAGSGIALSGSTGDITISSTGADLINVIRVTANYTATATDEYIGVYSASAITITLPAGVSGRVYTIKDEYGQGNGKITIQPQTGEKVDDSNNYIIRVPYQSVSVVYRGTGWWRI